MIYLLLLGWECGGLGVMSFFITAACVMDSQLFAGPVIGIFCSGLNAYCMQTGPLFLRISGSSGVLKAVLLERNRQLSCNPKKKKKKKKASPSKLTRYQSS